VKASPTLSKKKAKAVAIDGFGTVERSKLSSAIRQVWQRSKQWRIVKSRCIGEGGYSFCEQCGEQAPKIFVDHIVAIGAMEDPGYFERLMVSSDGLQGLCNPCHKPKTKVDNAKTKAKKKSNEEKYYSAMANVYGGDVALEDAKGSIDKDIADMDLFTHEKIALQKERNTITVTEPTLDLFI